MFFCKHTQIPSHQQFITHRIWTCMCTPLFASKLQGRIQGGGGTWVLMPTTPEADQLADSSVNSAGAPFYSVYLSWGSPSFFTYTCYT
jgi:hypothetical protein